MTIEPQTTPGSKLVIDQIQVAYGDTIVVDNFSLEVEAGETMAVIGPSGSGKSTLLRAIAGLQPLSSGRILLNDVDLAAVASHDRGVGLMFQDHALFPHMDVADNVGYGLDRSGVAGSARADRIGEMLALVGLEGFDRRAVNQLSGGEAQRVALARALAPSPGLLMLDEPLGSLDRVLRDQLIDDLDLLLHRMGQTSLHITHDQSEAFALADRIAVMSDGDLVGLGTPKELWSNPGSSFVAEFLGRPNIWSLEPTTGGDIRWAEAGLIVESAEAVSHHNMVVSGTAVVPVSAISAAGLADTASDGNSAIRGTVTGSRFNQGRYRHRVDITSGMLPPVALVFVDAVERRVGDSVDLHVDLRQAIPVQS